MKVQVKYPTNTEHHTMSKHTAIPARGYLTAIISAEREYRSAEANEGFHVMLRKRLAHNVAIGNLVTLAECDGAYKGTPEQSIMITGPAGVLRWLAERERAAFCQESVLIIDHHGQGRLHFDASDDFSGIGTLQACEPGTADAWTTIRSTGETFTFA